MLLRKMEEFDRLSLDQKAAVLTRLIACPGLTAAIFLRRDMGRRVISENVGIMALLTLFISGLMLPSDDRTVLFGLGLAATFLGVTYRFRRWQQFRRGVKQHSYYIGTSIFNFSWLPSALTRTRFIETVLDPLIFLTAGYTIKPAFRSPAAG